MSDFFVWTAEELGLNVVEMDKEHQTLINKMNALHKAYTEKLPYDNTLKVLEDFAQFTVKHFSDEEAYMEKINFEGLPTHKIIHQQLLKQFQEFLDKFKEEKVLNDSFFNFLKVWLTGHIRGIDMKYANKANKKSA